MKLYYRADCPFCWKVRIFLQESGIEVEEIQVEFGKKHPDVVALNPNATVPVLVNGDLVLFESAVVIEYLADKFPQSGLMDGSAEQKAAIRQIHSYCDNSIGKVLFPHIKKVRETGDRTVTDELTQAWIDVQLELSERLGEQDFFGPSFSVAECALIPRVALALINGLSVDDKFSNLQKWFNRCLRRPSFTGAFPPSFLGTEEKIEPESLLI